MEKEVLEDLIDKNLSTRQIATILNVSKTTVGNYIKKYNLATTRQRDNEALKRGEKEILRNCSFHGLTIFRAVNDSTKWRCRKCNTDKVAEHRKRKKKIIINEHGGKCNNCGYNRCLRALEFHHKDKTKKNFTLSKVNWACSLEKLRKEANKCILLCSNCHREVEDGLLII